MTNGERIRQMTDKEIAALIANEYEFCSLCAYLDKDNPLCMKQPTECVKGFLAWLEQDVHDAEH